MMNNKKGAGLVTTTVAGIGALLIFVIIILVVTSTILSAGLFDTTRERAARNNQTLTVSDGGIEFGYPDYLDSDCTLVAVTNGSTDPGGGETISSGNYTTVSDTCIITATSTSEYNNSAWNVSSLTIFEGEFERTTTGFSGNFSQGIGNISAKIPTILLIVAVIFLFGALILLMRQASQMGIGGGSSL